MMISYTSVISFVSLVDWARHILFVDDDELMLNVLRCHVILFVFTCLFLFRGKGAHYLWGMGWGGGGVGRSSCMT